MPALAVRTHARELRLAAIRSFFQPTAGADQIADAHVRLEWIVAARFDAAGNAHDLARLLGPRLPAQLIEDGRESLLAAADEVEHFDAITWLEQQVFGRTRRTQSRAQVGRQDCETAFGRKLAKDHEIVDVRVGLELVNRGDDIAQPQALAPGEQARAMDVTAELDARVEHRTQSCY